MLPVARTALATADVYREADRLGLPRDAADLARPAARACSTAAADLPDELVVNDLEPAARSLCPAIDEALDAPAQRRRRHALVSGSGPTVVGLFADRAARAAPRPRPRERTPRPVAVDARGEPAML